MSRTRVTPWAATRSSARSRARWSVLHLVGSGFGAGIFAGGAVGALIQAEHIPLLEGELFDELRADVPEGCSAVMLLAGAEHMDAMIAAFDGLGGRLVRRTLSVRRWTHSCRWRAALHWPSGRAVRRDAGVVPASSSTSGVPPPEIPPRPLGDLHGDDPGNMDDGGPRGS